MVRCLPLWAIFTGFFSHFWLCTIIITYLPTYIHSVLHVNIKEVSALRTRVKWLWPWGNYFHASCSILALPATVYPHSGLERGTINKGPCAQVRQQDRQR